VNRVAKRRKDERRREERNEIIERSEDGVGGSDISQERFYDGEEDEVGRW